MRRFYSAMLVVSVCVPVAFAQGPPPPPGLPEDAPKVLDGNKPKGDDKEAAVSSSSDGIVPLPGDTVYFKNGSKLEGVTVVRESPAGIEVMVTENDSLMIPRKQIDRIEYKTAPEATSDAGTAAEPSILKGQKVSNELYAALTSPVPDEFLDIQDQDLIDALGKLAKKLNITIDVADSVKKIAPRERSWTASLPAGAKLSNLLEDGLLGNFPNLQLDFPQDKIVVSVKADGGTGK